MDSAKTGFWAELKKRGGPILAMAPMANVTDAAFRRMFAELGAPDVFWTEFVSVEGLLSRGQEKLLVDFWKSPAERPIVAQIFGSKPEQFEEAAKLVRSLGFDGIDINMGCPDRGVEKSGGGASLIKHPELAREIIRATKRGAGWSEAGDRPNAGRGANEKNSDALPVSVKTRIGYSSPAEMEGWLTALLEEDLAALTVHLRTRNEMSDVPARWELMPAIVALRNKVAPATLILGNGDVATPEEARARVAEIAGLDGVMVGRGMFGNPWFFSKTSGGSAPSVHEKLTRMIEHTELFEQLYKSNIPKPSRKESVLADGTEAPRPIKDFNIMKKHFKAYCSGFDEAKELRIKLMAMENAAEVREITEKFIENLP